MKAKLLYTLLGLFLTVNLIAADQVVTSNGDSGAGTLRQAIADVGAGETITFNLSAGNETIILTSDELLITKSLTIDGANTAGSGVQVTVQVPVPSTTPYRVFHIQVAGTVTINNLKMKGGVNQDLFTGGGVIYSEDGSGGSSVTLNLNNVTVEDGKAGGGLAVGNGVCYEGNLSVQNSLFQNNGSLNYVESGIGGGIGSGENAVNLSVVNSTFKNNLSIGGGGISIASGTATVSGCTFENNIGGQNNVLYNGGGIYAVSDGNSIVIENSTFYNNSSSGDGGAICAYEGSNVTVNSCTIFNNHATGESGVDADGGGIAVANGSSASNNSALTLRNNIIYGNTSSGNLYNNIYFASGTVTNQGYNIWESGNINVALTDKTAALSDVFGSGQNTQTLANDGGPTQTLAILPGSIAIGAGNTALTTDQRGYTRGTPTTIGAFAVDGTPPTSPVHPGGVSGENLWLKANAGVTETSGNLTGWTDQTGTNTFSVTGTPTYTAQGINFNPKVSFSNFEAVTAQPGSRLDGNSALTVVSGFAVYKSTDAGSGALVGSTTSPDQYGVQYFGGFGANQFYAGNGSLNQTLNYSDPKLSTTSPAAILELSYAAGNGSTSRLNGGNKTINFGSSTITGYNFTPRIGGTNNQGGTPSLGWNHFRGEVAEIALYPTSLSSGDKLKVESYLAIKYGITLDQSVTNYLASDGSTVLWDNTTYWNDVFGIGQDDGSGLDQTSSNSINTGSGDGTGQSGKGNIVLSNASDMADGEFLMIGHDNAALTFSGTELPGSMSAYQRTAREWYVDKTGDVGTVTLTFDMSGISGITVGGVAADYAILQDSDGDFSDATKVDASSLNGNVITFNTLALTDGQYITFAGKISALPVELTSFTSTLVENKVQLNWATATEVNNYGFEIERSTVGTSRDLSQIEWAKVGFIEGHGNSNSPKEYSFIDETVQNGKYSYRLKQIDFDGKFEYSNAIEVEVNILPTEFAMEQNYPNPFNPTTTIKYSIPTVETGHAPSLQTNVVLKVYDILGNEVATLVNEQQEAGYYEVKFNASNLSTGVYIYRLNAGSFVSVKKMLMIK